MFLVSAYVIFFYTCDIFVSLLLIIVFLILF